MASGLSATELHAGALVGDFRLERLLARGGMGVVFEARQLSLGRQVALKLIAPEAVADDDARARFAREARTAVELEHPNLVPVYAAGEADGVLFIAMRLIEGADLGAIIAREGRLEPARVASLVEQVAAGLDAAHGRGLVHRDVKPGNVMVEARAGHEEHCYVVDFGVAFPRDGTALTRTGKWVGTPAYVAPEQLLGEPVDARTDVYALAGVCFHALTGQPPYTREHEAGVLLAHLNSPPPRASELGHVAPEVDAVISRALAKSPAQRFASAGEFARALRAAILGGAAASGVEPAGITTAGGPGEAGAIPLFADAASSFVGREDDLEQLDRSLAASRLVTIVGPGGVGKTRLALQLASRTRRVEEARLVELAQLSRGDDIALALARGLGLRIDAAAVSARAIAAAVGRRRMLVVLDNCEHIVAGVAALAAELLACSDTIVLLATSRQPLGLVGEQIHPLAPMAVPGEDAGPAEIAGSEAVRLLSERATGRAASPTDENATRLASICRRLEGIPLAIELAAARLRVVGAADLDERLASELGILGATHGGPSRHGTLAQLIDWSWRLLSEDQQAVLGRLSVLVGSFDLAAAERIGLPPGRPELDVCSTVFDLADRSLLQLEATEPRTRYRLLEPVRDFSAKRLSSSGAAQQAREVHRAHYSAVAERAARSLESRDAGACLRTLDEDLANVRAAILSGLKDEPAVALRMTVALQKFWRSRGLAREAVGMLAKGLERCPDAPAALRARALAVSAYLKGGFVGDYAAAVEDARSALELAGDGDGEIDTAAEALCCLSWISSVGDRGEEGMRLADEALRLDPAVTNPSLLARLWDTKALASEQLADPEGARSAYQAALRFANDAEDPLAVAYVENHLGHLASSVRDLPTAREHFSQALRVAEAASDEVSGATALLNLAYVEYLRGRHRQARAMFDESLATNRRHGDEVFVAISVFGLALTESDPVRAAALHGWAAARLDELGHTLAANDEELRTQELDRLRNRLGDGSFIRTSEHGAAMGLDDVLAPDATR